MIDGSKSLAGKAVTERAATGIELTSSEEECGQSRQGGERDFCYFATLLVSSGLRYPRLVCVSPSLFLSIRL